MSPRVRDGPRDNANAPRLPMSPDPTTGVVSPTPCSGQQRSGGSSPDPIVYPDGPSKDANVPAGLESISALWVDEDFVDHGYRTVAPDLE